MRGRNFRSAWLNFGLLLALTLASLTATAGSDDVDARDFSAFERGTAASLSGLIIRNLALADEEQVTLALRRVQPFAADAVLYVDGVVQGPLVSERVYFQGTSMSDGHTQVSLSIGPDGTLRGVLVDSRGHWRLLSRNREIEARLVSHQTVRNGDDHDHFQCGLNQDIRQQSRQARELFDLTHPQTLQPRRGANDRYRIRLAYDTTARFVDLFDSGQEAVDYLGDLTNYMSTLYINELNTEIVISSTKIRGADEPWTAAALDANGSGPLLAEFKNYWDNPANTVDQTRTLAHLVDAGPQQGAAYVGTLCIEGFDYGVNQGLGTEFDPNDDPQGWSFTVVAHEVGHNFNSDHTHCYDPVIDECFSGEAGCFAGEPSLPTGGPAGQAPGTIMSYCHLRPGGLNNIAVTLGRGHGFGVEPDRVPDTMRAHVLERAAVDNPRCPQLVTDPGPVTWTVTPSAGANGSITPSTPQTVNQGETTAFTVTPSAGYTATVAGTCGGNLAGTLYTTAPITQNCTVEAQFVSEAAFCEQANLAIPDNDPTGVASTLTLPPGGEIGKLELELEIDHTWVGDLIVELEHPNGTTVRLVDRPPCSGENIHTVLDDDAALSIQDDCQNANPAYPAARYRPANVLSGFNNLPVGGTWTVTVSDNAAQDTGVLRRWCLVPSTASGEIFSDRFEQ